MPHYPDGEFRAVPVPPTPAPKAPKRPRACRPRKPRLTIEATGARRYPWLFHVKYPGQPWKNSQWHTWDEALIALGLKRR